MGDPELRLAYALALRTGEDDPYVMLQRLSNRVWNEWKAYHAISPVHDRRIDVLFARLAAQLVTAILAPWNKQPREFAPSEFLAEWDADPGEQPEQEQMIPGRDAGSMLEKAKAWARHLGAKIVSKGKDDSS